MKGVDSQTLLPRVVAYLTQAQLGDPFITELIGFTQGAFNSNPAIVFQRLEMQIFCPSSLGFSAPSNLLITQSGI